MTAHTFQNEWQAFSVAHRHITKYDGPRIGPALLMYVCTYVCMYVVILAYIFVCMGVYMYACTYYIGVCFLNI